MPKRKIKKKVSKRGFKIKKDHILIVCGIGILLVIFFAAWKQGEAKRQPIPLPPDRELTWPKIPKPSLRPTASEVEDFKTRFFNPEDYFYENTDYGMNIHQKYPTELTTVSESDLTPLSCTKQYYRDYDGTYLDGDDKVLSDQKLLSYIYTLESEYIRKGFRGVKLFKTCYTEQGKTIVFYGIYRGGGGDYWGTPYIGVDTGAGIENATQVGEGACNPLQLLQGKFLYVNCSSGEGGGSQTGIYQLNLENNSVSKLLHCQSAGIQAECN